MKCPKCHYLGFETGDRCRICGYDFSLLAASASDPEPDLRPRREPRALPSAVAAVTPGDLDAAELPLFADAADDEPLLTVPAAPRPPVAVRRAPDTPRAKPAALVHLREHVAARRAARGASPRLAFPPPADADVPAPDGQPAPAASVAGRRTIVRERVVAPAVPHAPVGACEPAPLPSPCPAGARAAAAAVDVAILATIDVLVVYFTLRMSGLAGDEWRLLPPVPLVLFLMMLKLSYFAGFTAVGGQTIGKMAARIRVVGEDRAGIGPAQALQRTAAAGAALITLGGTFVPALLGRDRLAVHDRLAHTRVIALPPA